ncbi:MAG: alpha/beta hydrolase [Polyangiaceae bacterium]
MGARQPFRQGRFEELPQRPRRGHPFFETEELRVPVQAEGWPTVLASVRRHGSGPPLLLVHGLMTSGYSWRYALDALGARFTCYVPDLPGAGRTAPIAGDYRPVGLARWLSALIDGLAIRGCAAIGNSMGGYLAMQLALDDPSAMARLVNLHSPGLPLPRLWLLSAALEAPGSAGLLRWLVHRSPERWVHRNVHYNDESHKSLEEAEEYGRPLATVDGVRAFRSYLRDTLSPQEMNDFGARLRRRRDAGRPFPVPLSLVYAESDPMVPPSVGRDLAALVPGAELVWLREASHFAHVDAPEAFVDVALGFLGAPASDRVTAS